MTLLQQVKTLILKDIILEWRSKYAINGILLYVVSTVFVCYQAFKSVDTATWMHYFGSLCSSLRSMQSTKASSKKTQTGNFTIIHWSIPERIILAKVIYNMMMMTLLAIIAYFVYSTIFRNPVGDPTLYFISVILGSISFATVFTMISGISSKAGNNST
jgi:heme exporter protein B